jgi:hypothetical protein
LYEDINGNTEAPTGADRRLLERTFLAKYQGGFGFSLQGFFASTTIHIRSRP